jgi:hypothetical protein
MEDSLFSKLNPEILEKIEKELPRIFERKASLKSMDINKRNFFHWKKEGVIDWGSEKENDKRSWIRLNIYDFTWIKIVQTAREFGIPLSVLKQMKDELFLNYIDYILNEKEIFLEYQRKILGKTEAEIEDVKLFLEFASQQTIDIESDERHLVTIFGSMIHEMILTQNEVAILFYWGKAGFKFDFLVHVENEPMSSTNLNILCKPVLIIPIRSFIKEFLEDASNSSNLEYWGFISPREKKVLEAIKSKDFKSINIKLNPDQSIIIEGTEEIDLRDTKAKDVRRILGLKEYDEITVKYRNDKHVFIKNTRRI